MIKLKSAAEIFEQKLFVNNNIDDLNLTKRGGVLRKASRET